MTIITKDSSPSPTPTPTGSAASQKELDAAKAFGASAAPTATGQVYMGMMNRGLGKSNPTRMPEGADSRLALKQVPLYLSEEQAEAKYFSWTQKQRDDFRAKGLLSGLLTQGAGDLESFSLWKSLVGQASLYGAQNQQVGPMDILAGYVKSNSSGGWIKNGDFETNPVTGEKRYIGPQFKTTTQTNTDLSDPATARAIATQIFQQLLGRDPGQGEINSYAQALSSSEAQNPSATTTTTQYDTTTGEAVGSNSTTVGGMTDDARALLASDAVKNKKEYGATQAATTYMNALQAAVGS